MDLSNPWSLASGALIGLIGVVLLRYGVRQQTVPPIAAGLLLCIVPYFLASVLVSWLFAAGCLGCLYLLSRHVSTY